MQALKSDQEIFAIKRPHPRLMTLYLLRTVALCLLGPWFLIALLPLYFRYHTLAYRFDAEGVNVSWGILWRREIYLTYSRIQDIHISRGLFERWLGLATIHVQTAAGSSGAEMTLEGLPNHEAVRDFLYAHMRGGAKHDHAKAEASDEVSALLLEIRDELARVREKLEARG